MQEDKFYRADKLLEEEMENRLKVPTITEEERTRYTKDLTAADSFSREELGAKIKEYGKCFMLTWDGDLLRCFQILLKVFVQASRRRRLEMS